MSVSPVCQSLFPSVCLSDLKPVVNKTQIMNIYYGEWNIIKLHNCYVCCCFVVVADAVVVVVFICWLPSMYAAKCCCHKLRVCSCGWMQRGAVSSGMTFAFWNRNGSRGHNITPGKWRSTKNMMFTNEQRKNCDIVVRENHTFKTTDAKRTPSIFRGDNKSN